MDIKYEGDFSFGLKMKNLSIELIKNLITNDIFHLDLNGEIKVSQTLKHSFICDGNSTIKFFIEGSILGTNQMSENAILLENEEYYKGRMVNFMRKGEGYYISKEGLGIKGNFDNNTIVGEVVIYDINHQKIGTEVYQNATNIQDIIKKWIKKNKMN